MGLYLSDQHGVNPSLMNCFFCGEAKGVALLGKLKACRRHTCRKCFHSWLAPVTYSRHTANLSGERTEQCPACDSRSINSGPIEQDAEAPRQAVYDKEPCDKCKEYMEKGVILISVDPKKSEDRKNPWRTGGWIVVSEDYLRRIGPDVFPGIYESILEKRVAFVEDEVWDLLRWPRGDQPQPATEAP